MREADQLRRGDNIDLDDDEDNDTQSVLGKEAVVPRYNV